MKLRQGWCYWAALSLSFRQISINKDNSLRSPGKGDDVYDEDDEVDDEVENVEEEVSEEWAE